jgi:hypothetical protein
VEKQNFVEIVASAERPSLPTGLSLRVTVSGVTCCKSKDGGYVYVYGEGGEPGNSGTLMYLINAGEEPMPFGVFKGTYEDGRPMTAAKRKEFRLKELAAQKRSRGRIVAIPNYTSLKWADAVPPFSETGRQIDLFNKGKGGENSYVWNSEKKGYEPTNARSASLGTVYGVVCSRKGLEDSASTSSNMGGLLHWLCGNKE